MNKIVKVSERKCVGCQQMKPKKELIRVIRTKEGEFLLDKTGKLNGRGAYVCASGECFEKAYKSKGLERSFKMKVPSEIYETLKQELGKFDER